MRINNIMPQALPASIAAAALAMLAIGSPVVPPAAAQDRSPLTAAKIQVTSAWTRAVPPSAAVAVAYMDLRNPGREPDRLISAASSEARTVELHETREDAGITRMRPVTDGLVLPAGGTARLTPGGMHLMLLGPSAAFRQGGSVPLVLRFERAGEVHVDLPVSAPGARGPGATGGHAGAH